jgi:Zn ribbon nucleic-acid-binding protein
LINNKKYLCPECNTNEGVNILYGYPTDETLQSWLKKEVELGGCIIGKENPTHKCFKCGHQWKM